MKIRNKFLISIMGVNLIIILATIFLIRNSFYQSGKEALVEKARSIVLQAESAREFASEQQKSGVFNISSTMSEDAYLKTVPIVAAMRVVEKKSDSLNYRFKVPKVSPRNPDNNPSKYENDILALLKSKNLKEHFDIVDDSVRYFRSVFLTEDCLKCHGDPNDSEKYWGRTDGKDITGTKMEGWKAGEIHGAFEIVLSLEEVQGQIQAKTTFLVIIGIFAMIISLILALWLGNRVAKPISDLKEVAENLSDGKLEMKNIKQSRDETGKLINSMQTMSGNVNLLVTEVERFIRKANEGKLESQTKDKTLEGRWKDILQALDLLMSRFRLPIYEAIDVLQQYAGGNLKPKIEGDYQGDFDKLKQNINKFSSNLSSMIHDIKITAERSSQNSHSLAQNAETMASAIQEQTNQAEDIASAAEQLAKTAVENANSAKHSSQEAKANGELAKESYEKVRNNISDMKKFGELIKMNANRVKELGASSKEIGQIITVINEIADQTNMLALNAAIEAARAGEQGRGFAVVAEEVRKLAERTTESTTKIEQMIGSIQDQTEGVVDEMTKSSDEVDKMVEGAVNSGETIRSLVHSSEKITEIIDQITAATLQQTSSSEEISKNIIAISDVSNQNAQEVNKVAESAELLNELNENILHLLQSFRIDIDQEIRFEPDKNGLQAGKEPKLLSS